ncbi:MAG: Uma2 family endonuclease [Acidobacteriota bacterium]
MLAKYAEQGIEVFTEIRIRVSASRFRIPDICVTLGDPGEEILTRPPLLCIEILSPEDRMARVETRVRDFLDMGVPYVRLLNPATRQAHVGRPGQPLMEIEDDILRTENPAIEMPLAGLWVS